MDDWMDVPEQARITSENTQNCRRMLNTPIAYIYSIILIETKNQCFEYGSCAEEFASSL